MTPHNEEDCLRSRGAILQTIPLNEAAGQGRGLWGLWPGRNGRGRLAWVGGGRCRDDDGRVLRAVEDRGEGDEGRPGGARGGATGGEEFPLGAIRQQAVVADADEPGREHMEQEAPQELDGGERHVLA